MALAPEVPQHVREARWIDLAEGETIAGRVVQLPAKGAHSGTRLFLRRDDGTIVCIAATARRGWSVLEKALVDDAVCEGDKVQVTFDGWRRTRDKERVYRSVHLMILERAR